MLNPWDMIYNSNTVSFREREDLSRFVDALSVGGQTIDSETALNKIAVLDTGSARS